MPKIQSNLVDIQRTTSGVKVTCNQCQLWSLEGIENLVNPQECLGIDVSNNLLRQITPYIDMFPKLIVLDLSINQLRKIEGINTCAELKVLNLSNNMITRIENLSNLKTLRSLNLSMNQISRLEGLNDQAQLEVLDLSGNNLKYLENLEFQTNLKELYVQNNQLVQINYLGLLSIPLVILYAQQNQITGLQELIMTLTKLPTLKKLDLHKNSEVTNDPTYQFLVISSLPNLEWLDGSTIHNYIRTQMSQCKVDYDMDQIVKLTTEIFNQVLSKEQQSLISAKKFIRLQEERLEEEYKMLKVTLQQELEQLYRYVEMNRARRARGEQIQINERELYL